MNSERCYPTDPAGLRLIDALKAHLPILMAKHQTPGLNIAVADQGRLIWEAGYGWADIGARRAMDPDTTYHSGSLGKVYTATAIMVLVDRGVIALSDPINRHLPFEVHNPLGAREITVHDLMVHKSGLGEDAAGCRWTAGAPLAATLEAEYGRETSPMSGGQVPRWRHPVGACWLYSNLGIATLGLIVEHANPAGLSFDDFVQVEVMDPLGMTLSQYPRAQDAGHVRSDIWAMASTGYSRMGKADVPSFPLCFGEFPAGGVMGRPADHIRLLVAMMQGGELDGRRILSEASVKTMLSPATELRRTDAERAALGEATFEQGLVWRLDNWGQPHQSFRHNGGHMFGWRTEGRAWPKSRTAVMVAVNQWSLPEDCCEVFEIADFVDTWLRYRAPVDAAEQAPLPASEMSFARGVLLAASYRFVLGLVEAPPASQFEAIISGVRDRGDDWDAAAFRRGFEAIYGLPATLEALQRFWSSPECEIDDATLRAAHAALGGQTPGFLTDLMAR